MRTTPRSGIFISYRRSDSSGWVRNLADRLELEFGSEAVFLDLDGIAPGEDFVQAIEERLRMVGVVLAVIGPRRLELVDGHQEPRLFDSDDRVRGEIKAALDSGVTVIPVLVGGAKMPTKAGMPRDLEPLLTRNYLEITDSRFDFDTQKLIDSLAGFASHARLSKKLGSNSRWLLSGALTAAALIGLVLWFAFAGSRVVDSPIEIESTWSFSRQRFAIPVTKADMTGLNLNACEDYVEWRKSITDEERIGILDDESVLTIVLEAKALAGEEVDVLDFELIVERSAEPVVGFEDELRDFDSNIQACVRFPLGFGRPGDTSRWLNIRATLPGPGEGLQADVYEYRWDSGKAREDFPGHTFYDEGEKLFVRLNVDGSRCWCLWKASFRIHGGETQETELLETTGSANLNTPP